MKQSILVAGGAGYIGSHVCWQLYNAGYTPVVLDDLSVGHKWAVRWGDLVCGDIADQNLVLEICEKYRPLALINLAAYTDVALSMQEPERFFNNNVVKNEKLFRAAHKGGIRHIVLSSTAAVYGVPQLDGTVHENTVLQPANAYGKSKIEAERILLGMTEDGVSSFTLRYFNAAGAAPLDVGIGEAHWPETNLIPRVILSAMGLEGRLSIFGNDYDTPDGTAIRDYIHVFDLARAHVLAVQYLMSGGSSETCNLGTGEGTSVKKVVNVVEEYLKCKLDVEILPRRPGDVPIMVARSNKAESLLSWQAKFGLKEIISSASDWHQSQFYKSILPSLKVKINP